MRRARPGAYIQAELPALYPKTGNAASV